MDNTYFEKKYEEMIKLATNNHISAPFRMIEIFKTIHEDGKNEGHETGYAKGYEDATNVTLN